MPNGLEKVMKSCTELVSLVLPIQDGRIEDTTPTLLHCHHKVGKADMNSTVPMME
jgi:hypothetical protein